MTKNDIQKKCTQTFRKYDPFQSSVVEVITEAQAPPLDHMPRAEVTTIEAPALVPLETLSLRSGVEEIKKIAEHLTTNVYTANHFSLLRLVGKLSKRVCSLIEQSIKYKHYADGSKERQMLFPGSRVPAPSLFSNGSGQGRGTTQEGECIS